MTHAPNQIFCRLISLFTYKTNQTWVRALWNKEEKYVPSTMFILSYDDNDNVKPLERRKTTISVCFQTWVIFMTHCSAHTNNFCFKRFNAYTISLLMHLLVSPCILIFWGRHVKGPKVWSYNGDLTGQTMYALKWLKSLWCVSGDGVC